MNEETTQYHSANFPQFKRDKTEKFNKDLAKTAMMFNKKEDWLTWLKAQPLKRSYSENKTNSNIFHVHIPKTGGISLKHYIYGDVQHHNNFGHHSAWRLREWFKNEGAEKEWNSYYKFAVVRNPWDLLWSGYKYTKWGFNDFVIKSPTPNLLQPYNPQIIEQQTLLSEDHVRQQHQKNVNAIKGQKDNRSLANSFKEYVEVIFNSKQINPFSGRLIYRYDEDLGFKRYMNMPFTQYQFPYIVDYETEEILVDHVGRFENFKETVYHLAEVTGDTNIIHSYNLSTKNVSATEIHYKNMYDDDMINMVGEIYREDILRFNYDY